MIVELKNNFIDFENSENDDDFGEFSVPLPEGFVPDVEMFGNKKPKSDGDNDESDDGSEEGVSIETLKYWWFCISQWWSLISSA